MTTATYSNLEIASQRKPVEVFHFYVNDSSLHYRYTSHDAPVAFNGATYNPAYISRGENEKDSDLQVSKLSITVAQVNAVIKNDLTARQAQRIWVEVYKLHKEDLSEGQAIFIGQIRDTIFDGVNVTIECVGFEHFLKKKVPTDRYQPTCNNTVFDTRCSLATGSYVIPATITSVATDQASFEIVHAAATQVADNYLQLGYVKTSDGNRRLISGNTSLSTTTSSISLRFSIGTLSSGDVVRIFPGCQKTIQYCESAFGNSANFFGFPFIPLDNPALWT